MTEIIIGKGKPEDPKFKNMEERISFILMKAGVPPNAIDACIEWAFGSGAWYVPIYPDWVNRWHTLHPDKPIIRKKESFVEVIYVIGFMYAVHLQREAM